MFLTNLKIIIFMIAALAPVFVVLGYEKTKSENGNFYPLSDFTSQLADDDLAAGLRSLSSSELKLLSEFIDDESKSNENNAFHEAMKSYWNARIGSEPPKKKRTINDLYDELAHENAEIEPRENYESSPSKISANDGKCRCNKQTEKEDAFRTKRNSLNANIKEERNIDEYIKQLGESFPRDQSANINDDENSVKKKEHARVKRL